MTERNTIIFRSDDPHALMLALRDTFGPYLADRACLLFTTSGLEGTYIDRREVLDFTPPKRLAGPIIAIIKSKTPREAIGRLELMAAPMHGYGEPPKLVTDEEADLMIRYAADSSHRTTETPDNHPIRHSGGGLLTRLLARLWPPPGDWR